MWSATTGCTLLHAMCVIVHQFEERSVLNTVRSHTHTHTQNARDMQHSCKYTYTAVCIIRALLMVFLLWCVRACRDSENHRHRRHHDHPSIHLAFTIQIWIQITIIIIIHLPTTTPTPSERAANIFFIKHIRYSRIASYEKLCACVRAFEYELLFFFLCVFLSLCALGRTSSVKVLVCVLYVYIYNLSNIYTHTHEERRKPHTHTHTRAFSLHTIQLANSCDG